MTDKPRFAFHLPLAHSHQRSDPKQPEVGGWMGDDVIDRHQLPVVTAAAAKRSFVGSVINGASMRTWSNVELQQAPRNANERTTQRSLVRSSGLCPLLSVSAALYMHRYHYPP